MTKLNFKPIATVPRDGRPIFVTTKYHRDADGKMHGGAPVVVRWLEEHLCFGTPDGRALMSEALQCTHWAEVPDFGGDESTATMLDATKSAWKERAEQRDARMKAMQTKRSRK